MDLSRTVSVVPGGCHLAPDTADVGLLKVEVELADVGRLCAGIRTFTPPTISEAAVLAERGRDGPGLFRSPRWVPP